MTTPPVNGLSIDIEDWFQVQAFADRFDRGCWDSLPSRVEANTERVLGVFAEAGVHGTFFTLGWVAERFPGLVRRIVAGGHELASHGMEHVRVDAQTPEQFGADVARTKALLEDVGGVAVSGYRAASFSMGARTPWAHAVLAGAGYRYSSSIYPIRHDIYGMPDAPRFRFRPDGANGLVELPITTVQAGGRTWPCGGGGYFRLLPYALSRWAMRRVNARDGQPCIFYFHPWEVDPGQPRQTGLRLKTRVRHYTNLERMEGRLRRLLRDFAWDRVDRAFGLASGGD
jgi:polysaccharide deacetylase family protein (PEP-CTERM system associated)